MVSGLLNGMIEPRTEALFPIAGCVNYNGGQAPKRAGTSVGVGSAHDVPMHMQVRRQSSTAQTICDETRLLGAKIEYVESVRRLGVSRSW